MLETLLANAKPPLHLTPATRDRAIAAGLVPALRRRRARRRHGEAGARDLRAEQARDAQGQARARMRLRRRRLPLAQGRRAAPPSARCCSASTTTRARCSMSASARASPTRSGASWSSFWRPIARTRAGRPSVEGLGGGRASRGGRRQASARRGEPLEPGQGSVVGAAPAGARGRGRLRSHAGRPLPPHRAVSPLAPRQAAERLHVRAARGGAAAGARRDFRDGAE